MTMGISQLSNLSTLLNFTFNTQRLGSTGGSFGIGGSQLLSNLSGIQQSAQSFLSSIKDQQGFNRTELSLRNAAASLNTSNLDSAFSTNQAVSSDADAVNATALPGAIAGSSYEVSVDQLAQSQVTTGVAVDAAAPTGITTSGGYGQISITANGETNLVTFQLQGSETNQEALTVVANAINQRGFGVTANVNVNEATGEANLVLEGETGAANSFTVSDTVGNTAAFTGVGDVANITQAAQNAEFTVNGAAFESATNQPTLAATGLSLNLHEVTAEPVDITIQTNGPDLEKSVRDFVSQYNETLSNIEGNTAFYSQQSAANLQNAVGANANALREIGINVGAQGNLTIDEQKFQNAIDTNPDKVLKAFNGTGRLSSRIQMETERAINQSLASPVSGGFSNFFNTNFSYGLTANSIIASNIGLFFNTFF